MVLVMRQARASRGSKSPRDFDRSHKYGKCCILAIPTLSRCLNEEWKVATSLHVPIGLMQAREMHPAMQHEI